MDYRDRYPGENITMKCRKESYELVDKQKKYNQIIEILKESDEPMSAREISMEMFKRNYTAMPERNASAPRLTELSKKGIVDDTGVKTCQYTHRPVTTYKLR